MNKISVGIMSLLVAGAVTSCGNTSDEKAANDSLNTAATTDTAGWVNLFDGETLAGWHGFNKGSDSITNWTYIDGALVCLGATGGADVGGDIVTDKDYANFELQWEWKVDTGSNSGVMYHVVEDKKYSGPWETGPEYQIIDDVTFPDKLEDWQMAGADYAMHPAGPNKVLQPVGEWNTSKIIFNNGHVEHWLNGEKIVEFTRDSVWQQKKETGKWKDHPDYGSATSGKIALQDHGAKAYYRDFRIKEL